ncbi:MAG TPA: tRNA pseudouridine(38-40) synthase TruA, partial [Candidatus Izemoplasmatales bacterium]|nr:tRNA pseudouridine(38-40) synthase TruA [Candidatus Izemoplasmatales bacterium]
EKAAVKIDDLLLFDKEQIHAYTANNQILFSDLVLDFSPSKQTAYGYNTLNHLIKITYDGEKIKKIVLRTDKNLHKQIKITVAYDGSQFHGFQYQSNQRTVQGALSRIINPMIGKERLIQGASRTDSFVHAYGQVIHFDHCLDIGVDRWKTLLNHQLPRDIMVKEITIEHPLFHSRYDVYQKKYVYKISLGPYDPLQANYVHFEKDLNLDLMREALKSIIGRHDFSSFSKTKVDDPIRTIYQTDLYTIDDQVFIEITGNGFLRYMVRIIVAYLLKIGKSQTSVSMNKVLKSCSRQYTQDIANPHALYLEKIYY